MLPVVHPLGMPPDGTKPPGSSSKSITISQIPLTTRRAKRLHQKKAYEQCFIQERSRRAISFILCYRQDIALFAPYVVGKFVSLYILPTKKVKDMPYLRGWQRAGRATIPLPFQNTARACWKSGLQYIQLSPFILNQIQSALPKPFTANPSTVNNTETHDRFTILPVYLTAVVALLLLPGPDMLLIASSSMSYGRKVGVFKSLGNATSGTALTVLAAAAYQRDRHESHCSKSPGICWVAPIY